MPTLRTAGSKRRSRVGDFLAILLLLAIVAGSGWFWWHGKHSLESKKHPDLLVPAVQKVAPHTVIPSLVLVERKPEPVAAKPEEPSLVVVTNSPATNPPPPVISGPVEKVTPVPRPAAPEFPRPVENLLEAQVALARQGISPGSIDGAIGSQTRAALTAFQRLESLAPTGALDTNTESALKLNAPVLTDYLVAPEDLARLQPLGKSWVSKSQQSALEYETLLELVAEKAHAHPTLIEKLNPGVDWDKVAPQTRLKIPAVAYPKTDDKAGFVVIHLSQRFLEAFGIESNLMAHFPCSIAARVDKRPVGRLQVAVIVPNPNYTFDPAIFPESTEAQAIGHKLVLPPGPNNPVGVAWIGLDKAGYGMHGTPSPEQIGRTESHGCFRLANWDADYLLKLAWIGMPVYVEP